MKYKEDKEVSQKKNNKKEVDVSNLIDEIQGKELALAILNDSKAPTNIEKLIVDNIKNKSLTIHALKAVLDVIDNRFRLHKINILLKLYTALKDIKTNDITAHDLIRAYILDAVVTILDEIKSEYIHEENQSFFTTNGGLKSFYEDTFNKMRFAKNLDYISSAKQKDQSYRYSAIICYIYSMLFNHLDTITKKNELYWRIDRTLAEFFAGLTANDQFKYIGDTVLKALNSKNFKQELSKQVHLYVADQNITELLISDKEELTESVVNLNKMVTTLKMKVIELETTNRSLNAENALCRKQNESLNVEISKVNNRLEFEINKFEKQYESFRENVLSQIKKDLDLEILGVRDIIEPLNDETKAMIIRRLGRIDNILSKKN